MEGEIPFRGGKSSVQEKKRDFSSYRGGKSTSFFFLFFRAKVFFH